MAPHAEIGVGTMNGYSAHHEFSSASAPTELFTVNSPNVNYTDAHIKSKYVYRTTAVSRSAGGKLTATPKETTYDFKVDRKVPRTGMMLVGWGGNNGSTVTAGIIANRRGLIWDTREGQRAANYYGSVIMGSTIKLGTDAETNEEVNVPFHDVLPMVHPNDIVVGGWDISSMNIAAAMDRAQVLEPTLKEMVRKEMALMKPLPSIYYPDFIAANQEDRADNVLPGSKACMAHVEQIRTDIRHDICCATLLRTRMLTCS
jgi:myo-inositol-1-phosphate synthase